MAITQGGLYYLMININSPITIIYLVFIMMKYNEILIFLHHHVKSLINFQGVNVKFNLLLDINLFSPFQASKQ